MPIALRDVVLGLTPERQIRQVPQRPGPPTRIDGYTIGAPQLTRNAPHNGEMHPDGDELLFLISGRVTVLLEEASGERSISMSAGEALVVPRGMWHRINLEEPSQLLHITPGPGGHHRPLS
jgi:mannose-6-phosphate isomerase-like protein (cupin superfamily)